MSNKLRSISAFAIMACLILTVGISQSWSVALVILNLGIISAIMSLGVNIQWGYAGLFNVGTMGFAALGGLAVVLTSVPPVSEAWSAGGTDLLFATLSALTTILAIIIAYIYVQKGFTRIIIITSITVAGYIVFRPYYEAASSDIESVNPAVTGFLGGFGLPIILSWIMGGCLAAGAAWVIGKISLGLRSDYLAIATLGISEIIIALLKNEDWLSRGVKNVTGLPRPVPYEVDLQNSTSFIGWVEWLHADNLNLLVLNERKAELSKLVIETSGIFVKLCYTGLFGVVLLVILILSSRALNSPWGRMMRAIRDNETAANAMGKNITNRHLQVFVLGSAVIGIAGAMLTTLDGQLTPGTYHPLRFTFLIWVMVIVGGSGNNMGAVLGGFLIWFVWIEAEPVGIWLIDSFTTWMDDDNALRLHLLETAQYMRIFMMGLVLLLVMRFYPKGILPEVVKRNAIKKMPN